MKPSVVYFLTFFSPWHIYSLCTRLYLKKLKGISLGNIAGGMINIEPCGKHVISIFGKQILFSEFGKKIGYF